MVDRFSLPETKLTKCFRCGLFYPEAQDRCHHCAGLSKDKARQHGKQFKTEIRKQNLSLGRIFLHLAFYSFILLWWFSR